MKNEPSKSLGFWHDFLSKNSFFNSLPALIAESSSDYFGWTDAKARSRRNIYTTDSFCENHAVRVIRLTIADLYDFEGKPPAYNPDADAVSTLALKQFAFLPQPLAVLVEGDNVSRSFPEEPAAAQAEAVRLAKRASKRAAKAITKRPSASSRAFSN